MMDSPVILPTIIEGWEKYQKLLVAALAPLTEGQVTLGAGSELRTIGSLARHIVGARVRWLHYPPLSEGPVDLAPLGAWDRPTAPVLTGAELAAGLERSWQLIQDCLQRWTPEQWAEILEEDDQGQTVTYTRAYVIWHLIEHDLHHGGELSFSLGMHGLAAPDL
jgi:uncharacterized damage-inducible protein DinB